MSDPLLPIGTNRCKCVLCHRYFGGTGGFALHQRDGEDGRIACLDPSTLGLVERGGYSVRATPETFAATPGCHQAPTGSAKRGRSAVDAG